MTLVEKYETLLRRGMKEIDALMFVRESRTVVDRYNPKTGEPSKSHEEIALQYWELSGAVGSATFDDDDELVCDLITMHGLRWVKTLTPNYLECVLFELKRGTDLLDAIVQLTANLEPKND